VPVKGQTLLVEVLARLIRRGVDARLTIVGDGPELGALRKLADDLGVAGAVRLEGALGQDEVAERYERADVFATASFAEGIPVVLMEAMASGLPVVATAITGIPELVQDGESGYLVTPGRVDELDAALGGILSASAEEREAMGRAGRRKVEAEFADDRVAEQLAALFAERVSLPSG
jgi:glycosyltransferase involved in cell wall biosynthesis